MRLETRECEAEVRTECGRLDRCEISPDPDDTLAGLSLFLDWERFLGGGWRRRGLRASAVACNSSGGTGTHLRFSPTIECVCKERNAECITSVPFLDESCGGLGVLSTRSFPLLLEGGVIELPTSGQLSLSSTRGTGLGDCELGGLTTKGSSFSEPRVETPFAERTEREGMAPSRNPELVLGSRSCDATDGGGSFAGGMKGDLCDA